MKKITKNILCLTLISLTIQQAYSVQPKFKKEIEKPKYSEKKSKSKEDIQKIAREMVRQLFKEMVKISNLPQEEMKAQGVNFGINFKRKDSKQLGSKLPSFIKI